VPWCDGCDRFLNPNTLRAEGTCPKCDRKVAEPTPAGERTRPAAGTATVPSTGTVPKAPWHFKLLVVLTVLYLGWRFVELLLVWF
jgi:hypothetical protein